MAGNQDDMLIVPDMSRFAQRGGGAKEDSGPSKYRMFQAARIARAFRIGGTGAGLRVAARMGVVGAVALLAAAAAKKASGRSFENLGKNLAEFFFDDSDDSARANRKVRESFLSSESVTRTVAAVGAEESGVARQFRTLRDYQLQQELARGEIERDKRFDHQSNWDIIVDRIGQGVLTVMEGVGKEAAMALGKLIKFFSASKGSDR